ncbi:MAG: primosomal protein N', partial [Proteobacteria bacterium]|nr:primosomal protein N' [Pseudomonadota bacterium]
MIKASILLDMEEEKTNIGNLSPTLCAAITETIAAGQQVMLFINRRGFAPIVQCKKCGWHADCPDCSVGVVYHKGKTFQNPGGLRAPPVGGGSARSAVGGASSDKINDNLIGRSPPSSVALTRAETLPPYGGETRTHGNLICHVCGRQMPMPEKCPECGAAEISMAGAGVEKIAAEVAARWPSARVAIVSSDTMMSRLALERLVAQMESGEIDIVIGTQILAKGHHFPNLTLVGVIDADMGLFGADFRAGERTFQQLFQVAGRSGRGSAPGRVLLQTYQPEHPVLSAIVAGDRDALMAMDLAGRRAAQMPPYGQLIALIVECEREATLQKFCAQLAACAPNVTTPALAAGAARDIAGRGVGSIKIMGPIPAQIYQIRNWYRMRFLVSG